MWRGCYYLVVGKGKGKGRDMTDIQAYYTEFNNPIRRSALMRADMAELIMRRQHAIDYSRKLRANNASNSIQESARGMLRAICVEIESRV